MHMGVGVEDIVCAEWVTGVHSEASSPRCPFDTRPGADINPVDLSVRYILIQGIYLFTAF